MVTVTNDPVAFSLLQQSLHRGCRPRPMVMVHAVMIMFTLMQLVVHERATVPAASH